MENFFTIIFIVIGVSLFIFFIAREVFCWYWKINERLEELQKTNELLNKIYVLIGGEREENNQNTNADDIPEL